MKIIYDNMGAWCGFQFGGKYYSIWQCTGLNYFFYGGRLNIRVAIPEYGSIELRWERRGPEYTHPEKAAIIFTLERLGLSK